MHAEQPLPAHVPARPKILADATGGRFVIRPSPIEKPFGLTGFALVLALTAATLTTSGLALATDRMNVATSTDHTIEAEEGAGMMITRRDKQVSWTLTPEDNRCNGSAGQ